MAVFPIREFGDPVLRQKTSEVTGIDESFERLYEDMLETMYAASGVGLAAPQIGVECRMFTYDVGDGPFAVINPVITESDGEWSYEEGCLSIPELRFELIRPKQVHLSGIDLDGHALEIDADELLARCFQHEVDHLDGVLFVERLDPDQRKIAMGVLRRRALGERPTELVGRAPGL